MLIPYYKIVPRKEVFGGDDTGTNTVIKLITNADDNLKPAPNDPIEDKTKYSIMVNTLTKNDFTSPKNGYFEYKKELTENETKKLLESMGFNEYD